MVLKVENLSVTYAQKTVVNRISFQVKPGQVFGLLGANGAVDVRNRSSLFSNVYTKRGRSGSRSLT